MPVLLSRRLAAASALHAQARAELQAMFLADAAPHEFQERLAVSWLYELPVL
jgi:hypothetical protein